MSDTAHLSTEEKVFLAGAIKALVLADRDLQEAELEGINRITDILGFQDYEQSLEEFESQVQDRETFFEMAKKLKDPTFQSLVTQILYDLALQEGSIGQQEEKLIGQLKDLWNS